MVNLLRSSALLAAIALTACASAPVRDATAPSTHEGPDGIYEVDIPGRFSPQPPPKPVFKHFFVDAQRDQAIAILVEDGDAIELDDLDLAVETNATQGADDVDILDIYDVALGGFVAHRSGFMMHSGDGKRRLMLNTHCVLDGHAVQVIVGGRASDADQVRALMEAIEGGGLRFGPDVRGPIDRPPVDVMSPGLAVRFSNRPQDWAGVRPGTLNDFAFLELKHAVADMWFMGITEDVDPEEATSPDYFDDVCSNVHLDMAQHLDAVPPGDTSPYDAVPGEGDRRWSLGGFHRDLGIPLVYRMRVMRGPTQLVRLYCWGPSTGTVRESCDALFDLISLAEAGAAP